MLRRGSCSGHAPVASQAATRQHIQTQPPRQLLPRTAWPNAAQTGPNAASRYGAAAGSQAPARRPAASSRRAGCGRPHRVAFFSLASRQNIHTTLFATMFATSICGANVCKWELCTVHHNLVLIMLLYGVHTTCECSGAVEHGLQESLCIVLTCSWCVANFGTDWPSAQDRRRFLLNAITGGRSGGAGWLYIVEALHPDGDSGMVGHSYTEAGGHVLIADPDGVSRLTK
jgi:hypothetical protein